MTWDTNPSDNIESTGPNGLRFTVIDDKTTRDDRTLQFYERNPARRGLHFNEHPEDKPNFVMYAVELRCLHLVIDTKKKSLPPMEDMEEAATIILSAGLQPNKEPRKDPEKLL